MSRSILQDRRGGAHAVQTIILVSAIAIAGVVSFKTLGGSASNGADCAGRSVAALAAVPCEDDDGGGSGAPITEPPPAPEPDPPPPESDEEEPEEFDPAKELADLALDILGVTDAVDCFTEGDILACVMTVVSFSPFKLIGIAVKLAKNAKKIKEAVERLLSFRKKQKAEEEARKAREIAECEGLHTAYKAAEKACRACKGTDTPEERAAKIACIGPAQAGRATYLRKKCDFILPGSIARGSKVAEDGHKEALVNVGNMLAKCNSLPTKRN